MIILKNKDYDKMVDTLNNLKEINSSIAGILEKNGTTYHSLSEQILEVQKENEKLKRELELKQAAMSVFEQSRKKILKQRDILKKMVELYHEDFDYLREHNLCSLCADEPDKDSCGATCNFVWKHDRQMRALVESLKHAGGDSHE